MDFLKQDRLQRNWEFDLIRTYPSPEAKSARTQVECLLLLTHQEIYRLIVVPPRSVEPEKILPGNSI